MGWWMGTPPILTAMEGKITRDTRTAPAMATTMATTATGTATPRP